MWWQPESSSSCRHAEPPLSGSRTGINALPPAAAGKIAAGADAPASAAREPAGFASAARAAGPASARRPVALLLCLLICAALSGCGYTLASSGGSILGDGTKTLKVKGVDSPTLHAWLPSALRSRLRDEINARYLARWVDSGSADFEIQLNVLSFISREWIRTEQDTAQMYSISLTLEAVIFDGSSNKEIWRGQASYSDYQDSSDEKAFSADIITQVVRKLADQMRNTF